MPRAKTLLLTRPAAQSRALAGEIAGFSPRTNCLISPLLDIVFCGRLPDLALFRAVVFTSANGVRAYLHAGGQAVLPALCVGARTARVAQQAGFAVQSADGDVAALKQLLDTRQGPFLHVRGEHVAGDLSARADVTAVVLYRQTPLPLNHAAMQALAGGEVDGVVLYSPRTAGLLADLLAGRPDWPLAALTPLCLSRNIAAQLAALPLAPAQVAQSPRRDDMLALIRDFLG